jgi:hypothetical protein
MAPIAGYNATLSLSGTSTAMVEEPCTEVSWADGIGVHQITAATKRVLDPTVAVEVLVSGVPVAASLYTVDYLFGIVTGLFDSGDPVTVSANYLPLVTVAEARAATVAPERPELDTSVFGTEEKSHILGQRSASVELETLHLLTADADAGGGTLVLGDVLENGSAILVEVNDSARTFRGWCRLPTAQQSIPIDEVVTSSLTWKTTAIPALSRPGQWVAFAWSAS